MRINILTDVSCPITIAVDGEAGSGKGSFCKKFAGKYNLLYCQSSIYYRKFALLTLNLSCLNAEILGRGDFRSLIEEVDNSLIYSEEVSMRSSIVAADKSVREAILHVLQKIISDNKRAIMEGRDIGTIVAPGADIKLYFKADIDERARRRYKQYLEAGQKMEFNDIKNSIIERDKRDMERKDAPLTIANDAIIIDNSLMDEEEFFSYTENVIIKNCYKEK